MKAVLHVSTIKGALDSASVHFTDDSGRTVSIAFDKRAVSKETASWGEIAEYPILRDCPVMLPGGIGAELTDLSIALFELEAQDVRVATAG